VDGVDFIEVAPEYEQGRTKTVIMVENKEYPVDYDL